MAIIKRTVQKEASSAYFARTRPRFLDWLPPTREELLHAAKTRSEDREAQLKKVTELEKDRQKKKASERKTLPGR